MTEKKNQPFKAKANVENGYLTFTNTVGQPITTPTDYSGRIATLLETIAAYLGSR